MEKREFILTIYSLYLLKCHLYYGGFNAVKCDFHFLRRRFLRAFDCEDNFVFKYFCKLARYRDAFMRRYFNRAANILPVLARRVQRFVYARTAYLKGEIAVGVKASFFYGKVKFPVYGCAFTDIEPTIRIKKYFYIVRRLDSNTGREHIAAFQQWLQEGFNTGFGSNGFHYLQKERGHRVSPFIISLKSDANVGNFPLKNDTWKAAIRFFLTMPHYRMITFGTC